VKQTQAQVLAAAQLPREVSPQNRLMLILTLPTCPSSFLRWETASTKACFLCNCTVTPAVTRIGGCGRYYLHGIPGSQHRQVPAGRRLYTRVSWLPGLLAGSGANPALLQPSEC
jgi:hypothetical protein